MARIFKGRFAAGGVTLLVVFFSFVAVALAFFHITNGVHHGLRSEILGPNSVPYAQTNPSGTYWSSAAVRHYFDDGTYNTQCERYAWGFVDCFGSGWGSAPCQKRYVGGSEGALGRHWLRLSGCPGQQHA